METLRKALETGFSPSLQSLIDYLIKKWPDQDNNYSEDGNAYLKDVATCLSEFYPLKETAPFLSPDWLKYLNSIPESSITSAAPFQDITHLHDYVLYGLLWFIYIQPMISALVTGFTDTSNLNNDGYPTLFIMRQLIEESAQELTALKERYGVTEGPEQLINLAQQASSVQKQTESMQGGRTGYGQTMSAAQGMPMTQAQPVQTQQQLYQQQLYQQQQQQPTQVASQMYGQQAQMQGVMGQQMPNPMYQQQQQQMYQQPQAQAYQNVAFNRAAQPMPQQGQQYYPQVQPQTSMYTQPQQPQQPSAPYAAIPQHIAQACQNHYNHLLQIQQQIQANPAALALAHQYYSQYVSNTKLLQQFVNQMLCNPENMAIYQWAASSNQHTNFVYQQLQIFCYSTALTQYRNVPVQAHAQPAPRTSIPSMRRPVRRSKVSPDISEDEFLVDDYEPAPRKNRPRRARKSLVKLEENDEEEEVEDSSNEKPADAYEIERIIDHKTVLRDPDGFWPDTFAPSEFINLPDDAQWKSREGGVVPDGPQEMFALLVKWKGFSHLHNTWELIMNLEHLYSFSRVTSYFRNVERFNKCLEVAKEAKNSEEVERLSISRDDYYRYWKEVALPEKILSRIKETDNDNLAYRVFVKWNHLNYDESTWEDEDDILKLENGQTALDEFNRRKGNLDRTYNRAGRLPFDAIERPPFETIRETPFLREGCILRDYQLVGLNFMAKAWHEKRNSILADQMGLGKTIQSISLLAYLTTEKCRVPGPFLVIVPLTTLSAWQEELKLWAPQLEVVTFAGNKASRDVILNYEIREDSRLFHVLLTTPEVARDNIERLSRYPGNWRMLMVDEAHKLKNADSCLYKALSQIKTDAKLLITGTPLQNDIKELWSLLHFLQPDAFSDYASFESKYGPLSDAESLKRLHEILNHYVLRRDKSTVEKDLPHKTERILRIGLTPLQKQYYKWVLMRKHDELRKGASRSSSTSLINVLSQLQKVCNHPFLFDGCMQRLKLSTENGEPLMEHNQMLQAYIAGSGKLQLLHALLERLKKDNHRVLIFSQMVSMLDLLATYCQYASFAYQRLDGTTPHNLRKEAIQHFNAPGSTDFIFLLSTKAGGLGINLQSADTVIIFDSDWNPQNDLQAMARAHRIGQKHAVNIYRFVSAGTVEEDILERAKNKLVLDHLVMGGIDQQPELLDAKKAVKSFSAKELSQVLRYGAETLFAKDETDESSASGETTIDGPAILSSSLNIENIDLDDILNRAEEHSDLGEENSILRASQITDLTQIKGSDNPESDESFWSRVLPQQQLMNELVNSRTRTTRNSNSTLNDDLDENTPVRKPTPKEVKKLVSLVSRWPDHHYASEIYRSKQLNDFFDSELQTEHVVEALLREAVRAYNAKDPTEKRPLGTFFGTKFEALEIVNKARNWQVLKERIALKNSKDGQYSWCPKIPAPEWNPQWTIEHDEELLTVTFEQGFCDEKTMCSVSQFLNEARSKPGCLAHRLKALLNQMRRDAENEGVRLLFEYESLDQKSVRVPKLWWQKTKKADLILPGKIKQTTADKFLSSINHDHQDIRREMKNLKTEEELDERLEDPSFREHLKYCGDIALKVAHDNFKDQSMTIALFDILLDDTFLKLNDVLGIKMATEYRRLIQDKSTVLTIDLSANRAANDDTTFVSDETPLKEED